MYIYTLHNLTLFHWKKINVRLKKFDVQYLQKNVDKLIKHGFI